MAGRRRIAHPAIEGTMVAALARAAHARDDMDIYVLLECTMRVRSSLTAFSRTCANPLSSLGVRARSAGSTSLTRAPAVALVSPHSHASHAHGPRRLVMAWCAMRRLCGVVRRHCVRCERVFNFSLSRRKK